MKQWLHPRLMWILTNRFWESIKACMLMIVLFGIGWHHLLQCIERGYFISYPTGIFSFHFCFLELEWQESYIWAVNDEDCKQECEDNDLEEAEHFCQKQTRDENEYVGRLEKHEPTKKKLLSVSVEGTEDLQSQLEQPMMWWSENLCLHRAIKNPTVCTQQRLEMSCQDVNTAGGISMCSWACYQQARLTKRKISLNYLELYIQ